MKYTPEQELKLAEAVMHFVDDPLGFVRFVFDWGQGDLAGESGPDEWQADILELIGSRALTAQEALRIAVASGHGIGKTTLVAWIILWFISTRPKAVGVVTANTKNQLTQKTWRELNLWLKRSIHGHWFEWSATRIQHTSHPETWFIAAVPWSEHNSEAFAGLHGEYVLVVFDEASAIADIIWEVAEGAMTTAGALWVVFGNPTRTTGRFRECFGRFRHRWITRQIDSRTAKKANKKQLQQWVDDYGDGSDFVKVRVKGEFPSASSTQFISQDVVDAALARKDVVIRSPRVMGVDVARFGDDQSVILLREGSTVTLIRRYRGLPLDQFAGHVAQAINELTPDAVFVDGIGVGGGVVDILRGNKFKIDDVVASASPLDARKYANLRAEMWGNMRDWLGKYGCLPDDRELRDDLVGVEYGFSNTGSIQLEKKDDMKQRGLPSPDVGDALAMTFARPVASQAAQDAIMARFAAATSRTTYAASRPQVRRRA